MLEKLSCILIRYKYPLMGIVLSWQLYSISVQITICYQNRYNRIDVCNSGVESQYAQRMLGQMSLAMRLSFGIGAYTWLSSALKMGCYPR